MTRQPRNGSRATSQSTTGSFAMRWSLRSLLDGRSHGRRLTCQFLQPPRAARHPARGAGRGGWPVAGGELDGGYRPGWKAHTADLDSRIDQSMAETIDRRLSSIERYGHGEMKPKLVAHWLKLGGRRPLQCEHLTGRARLLGEIAHIAVCTLLCGRALRREGVPVPIGRTNHDPQPPCARICCRDKES